MNLSFKPCAAGVVDPTHSDGQLHRTLCLQETDSRLQEPHVDALCELVGPPPNGVPCSGNSSIGRSILIKPHPDSQWGKLGIKGIKLKGAFGLEQTSDGKLSLVLPSPLIPFGTKKHWHIQLTPNIELRPVASKPKGLHTLSLAGALQEMRCHNLLSQYDLGLPGLAAGRLEHSGTPILDLNNEETGTVFIQHDPNAHELFEYMVFTYRELTNDTAAVSHPGRANLNLENGNPLEVLVDNYCRYAGMIGDSKGRAMIDAGIMRHSSHTANFLFDPDKQRLFQTDNDTCLLSDDMNPEERGAQLVRDICSTMQTLFADLALFSYSQTWRDLVQTVRYPIMLPFLLGVFKNRATFDDIVPAAIDLQRALGTIGCGMETKLEDLSSQYKEACHSGDHAMKADTRGKWHFIFYRFYVHSIPTIYGLCRSARLPGTITLKQVDPTNLAEKIVGQVIEFRNRILDEQKIK
jgi:hypothetical protein